MVQQGKGLGVDLALLLVDQPPAVPGEQFHFRQCGDVAHQVAAHEPQPPHVEDAEALRVGAAHAALLPGDRAGQEAVTRDVERVKVDLQRLHLHGIKLGVDEHPAPLVLTPDFRHPVILALARREVRAEAAARASRDALVAQQGDEQYGEVAAVAEDLLAEWPGEGERARVQLADTI